MRRPSFVLLNVRRIHVDAITDNALLSNIDRQCRYFAAPAALRSTRNGVLTRRRAKRKVGFLAFARRFRFGCAHQRDTVAGRVLTLVREHGPAFEQSGADLGGRTAALLLPGLLLGRQCSSHASW